MQAYQVSKSLSDLIESDKIGEYKCIENVKVKNMLQLFKKEAVKA